MTVPIMSPELRDGLMKLKRATLKAKKDNRYYKNATREKVKVCVSHKEEDVKHVRTTVNPVYKEKLDFCLDISEKLFGLKVSLPVLFRRMLDVYQDMLIDLISQGASVNTADDLLELMATYENERDNILQTAAQ
jgi:hypothetical protein